MSEPVLTEPQPFSLLEFHAARRPTAVALSTYERDYTYGELLAYATSIAGLLRRRGVRPSQLVVSNLRNEFNLLFMEAVYHEAAIWCTFPGVISDANPVGFDWLLAHEPSDSFARERTIVVDDAFMVEVAEAQHRDPPLHYESFDSVCRVSFSSGTTGRPLAIPSTVTRQGRLAVGWLESRPFFSLIQGFSGSGVKVASDAMFQGDTYICPGTPDENVTLAQRNFVSTLQGSPIQLAEFLDLLEQRENRDIDIATVQYIGNFISDGLLTRIRDVLGASVTACYGSTEVGMVAVRHNITDNAADVGTPLAHVTVEIVDEHDRVVPQGVDGIVRVRTTRRTTSYFRDDSGSRDSLRNGWFYPGDIGHISDSGHLVLSGRASDVINAGGVKFHPEVIDGLLLTHPGVRDGAIIPWADASGAAGYAALIVVGDDFDLSELIEPLRVACGGVDPVSIFRIDAIEHDQNGKVRRAEIAERVRALVDGRNS